MIVTPLYSAGFLDENVFIITDEVTGLSAAVDPCFQRWPQLPDMPQNLKLELILLTHGHFDHMAHARALAQKTGARVLLYGDEAPLAADPSLNLSAIFGAQLQLTADRLLADGDILTLGCTEIAVLHTPGHTAGSCCYRADGHLFTGDTVMAGSVGRCDFPTGDSAALQHSVKRIAELTSDDILHCGHGPDTRLSAERATNPYFS